MEMTRGHILWRLGRLANTLAQYREAKAYFADALAILGQARMHNHFNLELAGPGWTALGLEAYAEAGQHFCRTLRASTTGGQMPATLDALAGLAHLLAKTGGAERALALLTLALHHPACAQETKDTAAPLLAELTATLSSEVVAAAQASGKGKRIEEVVEEMLGQMEPGCVE